MKKSMNDIILDDKKMEVLIRELVKKANEKGVVMTKLNQAVETIWKQEVVAEKKKEPITKEEIHNYYNEAKKEPLTEEEEIFFEKVKKFLEHYGDDLIKFRNFVINVHGLIIPKGDLKWKKQFLEEYYKILCSIYAVFQREEKINRNKIICFLRKHFDYRYDNIGIEINLLDSFFYNHLYFSEDTELPVYTTEKVDDELHSIKWNEEFRDFMKQYDYPKYKVNQVAIAIVWFIEKYF